jgi:uncharacterized protein (TIGR01777 family)
MRILLTGGTGLIGTKLGIELTRRGHTITALTRKGKPQDLSFPARCLAWDHLNPMPLSVLCPGSDSFDALIHLAGESVSQRWSKTAKQKIFDSRIKSSKALADTFKASPSSLPSVWLNASAIGIYGDTSGSVVDESGPAKDGFLADVCKSWELSLADLPKSVRTVFLRLGVVLSNEGGALPKMITPFIYGLGGPLGHGQQYMSWIHIDDAVNGILKALEDKSIQGPVNIVAPEPVTNGYLTKELAAKTRMPAIFKAPAFILKIVLGEMSTMILSSANIKPTVLTNAGFKFKFPDIKSALDDLLAYCQPHGTRIFTARQWIKGSPSENFPFFSAAENLETITPPWLNFRIVAKSTPDVREGMLIDYKLKIKGVPVKWRTRIENWDPPHKFVDTQLRGPYKTWHHTHRFEQLGQGTLMTDVVRYRMHAWPIGDFALPMVKNDVNSIFRYRRQIIEKILSSKPQ